MKKKVSPIVVVGLVATAVLGLGVDTASATGNTVDTIANQVNSANANVSTGSANEVSDSGTELVSVGSEVTVSIPNSVSGSVGLASNGTSFDVGLPDLGDVDSAALSADNRTVVYLEQAEETSVAVQALDEGVRISTVMSGVSAPTRFVYPVDVPSGGSIAPVEGDRLVVLDASGYPVGYFAAPWAFDANDEAVPTSYEIDGSSVIQHVEHRGAGTAYPVVADPYLGKDLVKSARWTNEGLARWTLRVTPTGWARGWGGPSGLSYYVGTLGWKELYKKWKNKGLNKNLDGMRDQFICHQQFAFYKSTWNLDEWRPNRSYLNTVKALCNP